MNVSVVCCWERRRDRSGRWLFTLRAATDALLPEVRVTGAEPAYAFSPLASANRVLSSAISTASTGADGLHDEVPDVITDCVLVPVGEVEQALDTVRAELADLLGQRPAVPLLQRRDQPLQVVQCTLARFGPAKTVGEPGKQPG